MTKKASVWETVKKKCPVVEYKSFAPLAMLRDCQKIKIKHYREGKLNSGIHSPSAAATAGLCFLYFTFHGRF